MALPNTKVEIAFDSGFTTPAASRTWTDVSAYVEGSRPLTIGRGRADEVSAVQPSRLSLTLNNRDGRFTPRLASGAYYPNVKKGRPIRITVTYNAVSYTRYLGYVSEWPVSWPDGTSADAVVVLTSASRMARMGRGAEMRSVIEEEILLDSPSAYYTLGEPAGSTSAADSSGNQAPMLTMAGTGADVVFGNATGPGTDGLTAAEFAAGKYLKNSVSYNLDSTSAMSFLIVFNTSTAGAQSMIGDGPTANTQFIGTSVGNKLAAQLAPPGGAGSGVTSAASVNDGLTHTAIVTLSGGTLTLYLDGAPEGSAAFTSGAPTWAIGYAFTGALSYPGVFPTTLSAAQAAALDSAIRNGFAGDSSGVRIDRYASYAGIPAAEVSTDTGEATIGHVDITGMTPLAAMQKVTETENGALFDAKDGTLTFKGRGARYTVSSSFTLDCTAQEVEADLEPKDDDQFVVNDVTATANGAPAGRAIDQTSVDDQGAYKQNLDTVTDNVDDALAGAQWKVYQGADPAPRYTTVTVDVTNSSTSQADKILAAEIGTRFTLTNLPSQAPGSSVDLFVEGYSEEITATSHRITFNTSPAAGYDVWTIEDPVFGQYDAYPIAF